MERRHDALEEILEQVAQLLDLGYVVPDVQHIPNHVAKHLGGHAVQNFHAVRTAGAPALLAAPLGLAPLAASWSAGGLAKGLAAAVFAGLYAAAAVGLRLLPRDDDGRILFDAWFVPPGASADLLAGKNPAGLVGELHPAVAARLEIDCPCAVIEVDLSTVGDLPTREARYQEVSKLPQVRRDLAVLVDSGLTSSELLGPMRKQAGDSLVAVEVFDRYEGSGVPEGKVSVAFRLVFQRADRTLTDAEVTKATERVVKTLARRFEAVLR